MEDIQQICSGHLSGLFTRSQVLAKLNHYVQSLLPETLRTHCVVANLRDGVMVLQVDSAVWANQLRFEQSSLLRAWQVEQAPVPCPRQIVIRIVSVFQAETVYPPKPELSAENAALLENTANSVNDPNLSQALRRLAQERKKL